MLLNGFKLSSQDKSVLIHFSHLNEHVSAYTFLEKVLMLEIKFLHDTNFFVQI